MSGRVDIGVQTDSTKVIYLDGLCCTGKTSCMRELETRGFTCVYSDFAERVAKDEWFRTKHQVCVINNIIVVIMY